MGIVTCGKDETEVSVSAIGAFKKGNQPVF